MTCTLANMFGVFCNVLVDLGLLAKSFRSGTSAYPCPTDVFNAAIDRLVTARDKLEKAYFKPKGYKRWSEVHWYKGDLIVGICFPYKSSPQALMLEKGVDIPEGWELKHFKKGKEVAFRVNPDQRETIVPFLDVVFRRVYNCPDDYILCGKVLGVLPPS